MSEDPTLGYASPSAEMGRTGRSTGTWVKLLLVWGVGLVVWAAYLVAMGYLALKIL